MSMEKRPDETLLLQSDGFFSLDRQWRFTSINEKAASFVNKRPEDFLGKCIWEEYPALLGTTFEAAYRNVMDQKSMHRIESMGQYSGRWYNIFVFSNENGITVYSQDISQLKQQENALKLSEARYRQLFDAIDEGFCVLERVPVESGQPIDFRYVIVNPAFEKHTGRSNVVGKTIRESLLRPVEHILHLYNEVAETGKPVRVVYESSLAIWFDMYIFRIRGEEPSKLGLLFTNITERKKMETELSENYASQAFLLNLADMLRKLHDPSLIQESALKILVEHLGATSACCLEMHAGNCISKKQYPPAISDGEKCCCTTLLTLSDSTLSRGSILVVSGLVNDGPASESEELFPITQGIRGYIAVPLLKYGKLKSVLVVAQSEPRHWTRNEISLIHDTAQRCWAAVERARAEASLRKSEARARSLVSELEQANSNKNKFLNTLSHELRNPLAVISTGIQVLDSTQSPEEMDRIKGVVKRQVDHLCRLVDDLQDITRITHNKMELRKRCINLGEYASLILDDYRPLFEKKNIVLKMERGDGILSVDADPARLKQMIGNLLNNAMKFTDAGGEVLLKLYEEDGNAVICVQDTGIGMEPALLPRVFDPFVQADTSLNRQVVGLGLGLPIVQGIAHLHGGSIHAYSEGLGKGAKFCIYLPLCSTEAGTFPPASS